MFGATDIPRWCRTESGASEHELDKMRACSPMAHIDDVHSPTLLLIGDNDRRVPPAQGREWFYALRQRGVKVAMKYYSDQGHAINSVQMEADALVHSVLWFNAHLKH